MKNQTLTKKEISGLPPGANQSHIDAFAKELERVFSYPQCYPKITGSSTAASLLGQIKYWFGACDGVFYKTDEEFSAELDMGIKQFKSAKKKLKDLGFISVELKGIPARSYYTFNSKAVNMAIFLLIMNKPSGKDSQVVENKEESQNRTTSSDTGQQVVLKQDNCAAQNRTTNSYSTKYIKILSKESTKRQAFCAQENTFQDEIASEYENDVIETEKTKTKSALVSQERTERVVYQHKKPFNIILIPTSSQEKPAKTSSATQFRADAELTQEWIDIALHEGVHETWVQAIFQKFKDYWTGATGKKAAKKDWKATWRNWSQREATYCKHPKPASQLTQVQAAPVPERTFADLEEDTQEAILRRKLKAKLGDDTYHSWINNLRFEFAQDELKVYATTLFIRDRVQADFAKEIAACGQFNKVSLLVGKPAISDNNARESNKNNDLAIEQAHKRIDFSEPDPQLRDFRKKILKAMGDSYERLFSNVKLHLSGSYLKAYVRTPAHRSFLLSNQETVIRSLGGLITQFEVSIGEAY